MDSWEDMIDQMKAWIDKNIEENPSLADMAERLGYSYHYATKKFREVEGISFREYMLKCKIQKAANDLYATRERMIDIAIKYGYSSQEAFTRAFENVYGITPAVYRRLQKPTSLAEKSTLIGIGCQTKPNLLNGGKDMKLYVKQMYDWNYYGYYAEEVDQQYWEYFKTELWWQLGNGFIKTYDNVDGFEYCAKNFTQYGELSINQHLKISPTPWEKALHWLIPEMKKLGVDWFVFGSVAMALQEVEVKPKDINISIPNHSDYDKVRERFYKLAVKPFERCENWVASGLGTIFCEANIEFAFGNKELEPYDMSQLAEIDYKGEKIYISTLEMLRQDNEHYGRPDRVKLIEDRMKQNESQ